jgi:hypothetical protein
MSRHRRVPRGLRGRTCRRCGGLLKPVAQEFWRCQRCGQGEWRPPVPTAALPHRKPPEPAA